MKRATRRDLNLNETSPKEYNLNKISTGCAPCLNEALKIKRQINKRPLSQIKINEIKKIVKSIFKDLNNDIK